MAAMSRENLSAGVGDAPGGQRQAPEDAPEDLPDSLPPEEVAALPALLEGLIDPPDPGDPWVREAVLAVEASITKLMDEFRAYPFAHRVEHSLHARLFELLREWDVLRGWHPLSDARFKSQLIHKEWPETVAESGRKRGSFDIAVLAPSQLERASVAQFRTGQIAAPIVIELGLGYWTKHLQDDADKLRHSQVQHPYLVHFSRTRSGQRSATEQLINAELSDIKLVYVHHELASNIGDEPHYLFFKGLDGSAVSEKEPFA